MASELVNSSYLSFADVAGSWTFQPVAVLGSILSLTWYVRRSRLVASNTGRPWSRVRTSSFVGGVLLVLLLTCGPMATLGRSVFWIWVSQTLVLLLVAPLPLMCAQPIELSRAAPGGPGPLARIVASKVGRGFSSPLVGPALIPLACVAAMFGGVPGWAVSSAPASWLVQAVLLVVGSIIVLPLVADDDHASSVAVGAAVAVGFFELLLDAVPGLVLRLSTRPVSNYFDHRTLIASAPTWLHDQQIGGGILWCVAELLDLPFLMLVFRRWVRADAREAAEVDAALDRATLTAVSPADADPDAVPDSDVPWFVNDPQLRDRLR